MDKKLMEFSFFRVENIFMSRGREDRTDAK